MIEYGFVISGVFIMIKQPAADLEDSNEVERLYRRNALFSASVISIYSIAGGKLDNEISVGLTKISFSNPHALEYALVVVAIYFCWRHWLVSKELRSKLMQSAYRDTKETKQIERFLTDESNALLQTYEWDLPRGAEIPVAMNSRKLIEVGFINVKYEFYYQDGVGQIRNSSLVVNVFKNPLKFLIVSVSYRVSWFKKTVSDTHFGDGLMPLLVTMLALLLYCLNIISR
ncbi:hypothetical protein FT688_20820 [Aeromonas hydrophila]|nr:hypothetical protein FT688_20820 [Aeromonas hydrophila]